MTDQRTVLITGGTGSLGYQTAKVVAAADDGWFVVITGRDPAVVARSAADLAEATNSNVTGMPLDLGLNVQRPHQSAAALTRLVLDPSLQSTTGRYFSGLREIRSSTDSYDRTKAADLWTTSTELVGR